MANVSCKDGKRFFGSSQLSLTFHDISNQLQCLHCKCYHVLLTFFAQTSLYLSCVGPFRSAHRQSHIATVEALGPIAKSCHLSRDRSLTEFGS
jgi:hypothetical protein